MALSTEAKKLRYSMASDLTRFIAVINKHVPNCDVKPIERAVTQLKDEANIPQLEGATRPSNSNWGYEVKGVKFNINPAPDHTHPTKAYNIVLEFDIKIIADSNNCGKITDPYLYLEFNIVVTGNFHDKTTAETTDLICSYHLDKHISKPGDGVPKYPHPDYHFQFGGRKLNKRDRNFGCSLILDSPRIVHHPMDIILGIDFILSNFLPESWKELKKDGEYVNIIKLYQELFWQPYVHSKAWNWKTYNPTGAWRPTSIWPQLVSAR